MDGSGDLLTLAVARFGDLSVRERELIERASVADPPLLHSSDLARAAKIDTALDVPSREGASDQWNPIIDQLLTIDSFEHLPIVRPDLIKWLSTSNETKDLVHAGWIEITDCQITGALRLGFDTAHVSLGLRRPWLCSGLVLRYANMQSFVGQNIRIDPLPDELSAVDEMVGDDQPAKRAISAEGSTIRGTFAIHDSVVCGQIFTPDIHVVSGNFFLLSSLVQGNVDLAQASIDGSLALSGSAISPTEQSRNMRDGDSIALVLDGANASRFRDENSTISKDAYLSIDRFQYGSIAPIGVEQRIAWVRRQHKFIPGNYDQLAKILRTHGRSGGAKYLLEQKEWDRLAHGDLRNLSVAVRAIHCIWGGVTAFGHKPLRSLWSIGGLISVSSIVLWLGWAHGLVSEANGTNLAGYYNPLAHGVELSVPLLNLGQGDNWFINPARGDFFWVLAGTEFNLRWGQVLRWYTWLASIVGWVLAGFLVAGLGGLAKRD